MGKGKRALIVTDIQYDFCPGGALAVPGGDQVIPVVNQILPRFPVAVATQDWHPPHHASFASSHPGRRPLDVIGLDGIEQVLWPDHCVAGSKGAELHRDLDVLRLRAVIRKGTDPRVDSYSTFRDNHHDHPTGLSGLLRELGVSSVVLAGLATDYCVGYSARDAVELGFAVEVWLPACRAIDAPPGNLERMLAELRGMGVVIREEIPR